MKVDNSKVIKQSPRMIKEDFSNTPRQTISNSSVKEYTYKEREKYANQRVIDELEKCLSIDGDTPGENVYETYQRILERIKEIKQNQDD